MKIEAKVKGYGTISEDQLVFLDHVTQQGADYSGRKLRMFTSVGSRLEDCTFRKATILNSCFGAGKEQSEYINCSFDNARLDMGGGYARFVGCSFRNVDMRNWICFAVEMVDCSFSGKLRDIIFNGTVPEPDRQHAKRENNEFYGNDFSALKLMDVTFRTGIDLTKQHLPSGPDYFYLPDAARVLAKAREAVVCTTKLDPEVRRVAVIIIDGLQNTVENGQQQLFLSSKGYYSQRSLPRESIDLVFSLLRSYGA
jgi:hypothetical protein